MAANVLNLLDVPTRAAWREWLASHHDAEREVWLVFWKQHTGVASVTYEDAVEEALCYGWVDSLVRRVDDERYARKFTPRKAESAWSTSNRERYADLEKRGLLAGPGIERGPTKTSRSGDAPRPTSRAAASIAQRLKTNANAWAAFERLPPSHRRAYVAWIDAAKREETRERRVHEAIAMLSAGKKLGMK